MFGGKMVLINKGSKNILLQKLVIAFICAITIQIVFCYKAYAEQEIDKDTIINQQVQSDEIQIIENELDEYSKGDIQEIIQGYNPNNIMADVAKGNFDFSLTGILNNALKYLFKEVYTNIHILIKLVVVVILCSLLRNLQASFLGESVGELAFYACYIVIVSILIVSFNTVMTLGIDIIDNMVSFMYATIPILITLLVSGGNITSGGVFQPILIMIVEIAATIIRNVFIPLVFLSTILVIINNISDKINISKLAGFLKQATMWAMGLIMTVFIAVVTLQGSMGAVVDGIASKTAKFAIGFIPVVGGYLADAADTVIGCTLLIKNAAGIAVMIGIVVICVVPLLKIIALVVIYKITCALVEPISEIRITNCINEIANSVAFIFGIVVTVTFMFLISVTAIIGASNLSTMIR